MIKYIVILVLLVSTAYGQINISNNAMTVSGAGLILNGTATQWNDVVTPAIQNMKGYDVHFEISKLGTPNEYPSH